MRHLRINRCLADLGRGIHLTIADDALVGFDTDEQVVLCPIGHCLPYRKAQDDSFDVRDLHDLVSSSPPLGRLTVIRALWSGFPIKPRFMRKSCPPMFPLSGSYDLGINGEGQDLPAEVMKISVRSFPPKASEETCLAGIAILRSTLPSGS